MFTGFLRLGGVEVINGARTADYMRTFLPGLDVKCGFEELRGLFDIGKYVSPKYDLAPWWSPAAPELDDFYGLYPGSVIGADDSTRTMSTTELSTDGAVHSTPRHGSREIRFVVTAFAKTDLALESGMAWLRDVLAGDNCGSGGGALGCMGHEAQMFTALPTVGRPTLVPGLLRSFWRVETLMGPRTLKEVAFKTAVAREIEFVLSAGISFQFTQPVPRATLNMNTALNFTDPAGEDCSQVLDPYADFINDPYYPEISLPPQPPIVKPPNILEISSWRRLTTNIPAADTGRWGRIVPIVRIATGATRAQLIRVRFYKEGTRAGCAYEGEFLISYVPPGSVLTLDGIHREASVRFPDGRVVPGAQLLFGSDGAPFQWPSLGCHVPYTMVADMMPSQPDVVVMLDTAIRE